MPTHIGWETIALRLALTVIAGGLLGVDRSKHGHPAGLRTTLLVTLAASVAMIQMNLLIETNGKPSDSYTVMDLMRLPLGILTGVGFIGAGAIVKRDDMVLGVTTAATMWFATVVGLCMGGGQVILGSVSLIIGVIVLWNLRWLDNKLGEIQRAALTVTTKAGALSETELRELVRSSGLRFKSIAVTRFPETRVQTLECDVRWKAPKDEAHTPAVVDELAARPGVVELVWRPVGSPSS
jgi:putative Mg2+ transporter-C (MgtC) family protein